MTIILIGFPVVFWLPAICAEVQLLLQLTKSGEGEEGKVEGGKVEGGKVGGRERKGTCFIQISN